MADWLALTLLVEKNRADALSDWLIEEGVALSVVIEDADAGTEREEPQFDEPTSIKDLWPNNQMVVLLDASVNTEALISQVQKVFGLVEARGIEEIDNEDWVTKTQSQFSPIKISDRLWIVPTWHDLPDTQAINIRLDPGMAFGTGSHPTTSLCLKWLDTHLKPGQSLLDYGCGSGILAIAAGKLGASPIIGVDIDQQAVEAAKRNAKENQVDAIFIRPDQRCNLSGERFDIVIANILTNPLKIMAPLLPQYLNVGGYLVLSGILEEQAESVIEAYRSFITLSIDDIFDGWVRLVGQCHSPC